MQNTDKKYKVLAAMAKQKIINFYQDEHNDWVADLACGHRQHIRHNPPWQNRAWVLNKATRQAKLGMVLNCKQCTEGYNEP